MDWRAVEENEELIREAVRRKMAQGTDEALLAAAGGRLQLGFMRPWLVWINEERANPERLVEAFTDVIAAMICEIAKNFIKAGVSGNCQEFVEDILRMIASTAREDAQELDELGHSSMDGKYINMDFAVLLHRLPYD